jgi:N6-L-threonylcarbamoyladenine synthase
MEKAGVTKEELNAVAFTRGPGLLGALTVGVSFAKSLAMGLNIPMIDVDHMDAHILAHFIEDPRPAWPFLCLTASGGHTQLTLVRAYDDMEVVGTTKDDAVGEAFDKTAKLVGLPYPGGPLIDKFAKEGDPATYSFPKGDLKSLDFSFSGIKTAILYFLQDHLKTNPDFIQQNLNDICASVQGTFVDILLSKISNAAKYYGIKQIAISGGVSANSMLRARLQELGSENGWKVYIPKIEYCTDNAAMIAMAASYKYRAQEFVSQETAPYAKRAF